ncbi:RNase H family protein [Orenia marismortui]|uniref:Ribonuclease HI n=1 Tax=Orenia marismortui TaxID=46469 RepID=A0A4R8H9D4_9FIRM|nr:RNase H family protein [Orenia marismortui]TDX51664.1 ribonuclease HI [Orenia marismortui]
MAYKCEKELRLKAKEFIEKLKNEDIEGEITQVRDYMVKVNIKKNDDQFGNLNIYYSPKKEKYTLKCHELRNRQLEQGLISLWEGRNFFCQEGNKEKSSVDYQIYVDGSYIEGKIGYGVVILDDNKLVEEISGEVTDPLAQHSRQVGGELVATQEGVKWCHKNRVEEVDIFYDMENIKKWATGEYKTNKALTQNFKEFINKSKVKINWHKVKAHTGVKWNERADKLAKAGAINGSNQNRENNLIEELEEIANKFVDYLQRNGYTVEYKGIYNSNCAKLKLSDGINFLGHLNIYNTNKLNLVPKYHELKAKEYQSELEELWQEFLKRN